MKQWMEFNRMEVEDLYMQTGGTSGQEEESMGHVTSAE
jgi:hypothetical protein